MAYKNILNKFMILLETIPNKIDFYDIWEIRPVFEEIEKNLPNLTDEEKVFFLNLINKLNKKLEKVKTLDELAKLEIEKLFNLIKKEKKALKLA